MRRNRHVPVVGVALGGVFIVVTHIAALSAVVTSRYAVVLAGALLVAFALKIMWMRRRR